VPRYYKHDQVAVAVSESVSQSARGPLGLCFREKLIAEAGDCLGTQKEDNIIENKLEDCQTGFRPNKSTIDNIFVVRQVSEEYYEYNTDLYNIFIDYTRHFDSVYRNKITDCLS
jgi:hypothetical protein